MSGKPLWTIKSAQLVDWHDGDTARINCDLGFGAYLMAYSLSGKLLWECRIHGIDAPELKLKNADGGFVHDPVTGMTVDNPAGIAAREAAKQLIPPGTLLADVLSYDWDRNGGRWIGQLTCPNGQDFAAEMVAAGHAVWKDYG